jgi:restriction system protein
MEQRGGYWDEADQQTQSVERHIQALDSLLTSALKTRPALDFAQFKRQVQARPFEPGSLAIPRPAPRWEDFAPPPPSGLAKLLGSPRYERAVLQAREELERARAEHAAAERRRQERLAAVERQHAERLAAEREDAARHNAKADAFERQFRAGEADAVQRGLDWVLRRSSYPAGFPRQWELEYLSKGKQLIVRYQLPNREVIPKEARFQYIRTRNIIKTFPRPEKEIRQRYEELVSRIALRTMWELFAVKVAEPLVDEVVFNGTYPRRIPPLDSHVIPTSLALLPPAGHSAASSSKRSNRVNVCATSTRWYPPTPMTWSQCGRLWSSTSPSTSSSPRSTPLRAWMVALTCCN